MKAVAAEAFEQSIAAEDARVRAAVSTAFFATSSPAICRT
jgi:hypothetical protein